MATRKLASIQDTPTQLSQIKEILPLVGVSMTDLLNEEPFGIEQAASTLGVSRDKVVEYVKNEGLYHDKIAGKYQFYKSLILVWRLMRHLSGGKC